MASYQPCITLAAADCALVTDFLVGARPAAPIGNIENLNRDEVASFMEAV
jgi:hypothetical protein